MTPGDPIRPSRAEIHDHLATVEAVLRHGPELMQIAIESENVDQYVERAAELLGVSNQAMRSTRDLALSRFTKLGRQQAAADLEGFQRS